MIGDRDCGLTGVFGIGQKCVYTHPLKHTHTLEFTGAYAHAHLYVQIDPFKHEGEIFSVPQLQVPDLDAPLRGPVRSSSGVHELELELWNVVAYAQG